MKNLFKIAILASLSLLIGVTATNAAEHIFNVEINHLISVPVVTLIGFIPMQKGVISMAVALNQVVVSELTKQFKEMTDDFLGVIKDHSDKVNNDVINFNTIGADPEVLINNTTYPISTSGRTDDSVPVGLFKMETENTEITDDELQALPYDKKSSVMQQHKDSLKRTSIKLGLHSLAPTSDSSDHPILMTTGAIVDGRRQLTMADIIRYKKICDILEIPLDKRNLVLCSDHVSDILLLDNTFRDRYNTVDKGKIIKNLYSFNIFENLLTPKYTESAVKKAFGAAPTGTDRNASVFFSEQNAIKAMGSVKMYQRLAETDPENRKTVVGFKMYYLVSPVTSIGTGALLDGTASGSSI